MLIQKSAVLELSEDANATNISDGLKCG